MEAGLIASDAVKEGLRKRAVAGRIKLDERVCVVEGRAAADEVAARLEVMDATPKADEEYEGDHYHRSRVRTVRAGQVVARVIPGTAGVDGVDVFGTPIRFKPAAAFRIDPGQNVKYDAAAVREATAASS